MESRSSNSQPGRKVGRKKKELATQFEFFYLSLKESPNIFLVFFFFPLITFSQDMYNFRATVECNKYIHESESVSCSVMSDSL